MRRRALVLACCLTVLLGAQEDDGPETFEAPNWRDDDGTAAYIHVTEADMPLRISIGYPKQPPLHGSRREGREIAIRAMRRWEQALQPHLAWFQLEFTEDDDEAPVQARWKRRMSGDAAARGWIALSAVDGAARVGGGMDISTKPNVHTANPIRMDELERIVAHEFGHVLGLGHCFHCESIMNYSGETVNRLYVSDLDVRTFLALLERPNGMRVDGARLSGLDSDALPDDSR